MNYCKKLSHFNFPLQIVKQISWKYFIILEIFIFSFSVPALCISMEVRDQPKDSHMIKFSPAKELSGPTYTNTKFPFLISHVYTNPYLITSATLPILKTPLPLLGNMMMMKIKEDTIQLLSKTTKNILYAQVCPSKNMHKLSSSPSLFSSHRSVCTL